MKNFFKVSLISLFAIGVSTSQFLSADCALCENVREFNRTHPQPDEYYEDYLKREGQCVSPETNAPAVEKKEEAKSVQKSSPVSPEPVLKKTTSTASVKTN